MKTAILFDPGIRSLNKGDEIIMKSAECELNKLINNAYIIKCATHSPVVTWYQNTKLNPRMRVYLAADYKFICGSNLLWHNMFMPRTALNINPFNCMPYKNSVLVGVGTDSSKNKCNLYTKYLYSKILNKKYYHSVRDEETGKLLASMGYKYINTGCVTMWKFTPEFCKEIPTKKSNEVIFTLTDYDKDYENDQRLIDILNENYEKLYFWIQGVFDKEYFDSLKNTQNIKIIPPNVSDYAKILSRDVDYIGTRLHAGMFAMQHKKRTIVIAVDNRVRDLKKSYHINSIERNEIEKLSELINSEFKTDVKINTKNIHKWMAQFIWN